MRKFVEENEQKTMKKTKGPERHLTFTKETPYESKYLTHRVLPNIGATGAVHAEQVVDVLHEFNSENTIKAILVDNNNASLHHNERPFRALFKNIDGCAKGPIAFSGPQGKLCSKDCHDLPLLVDLWIQFWKLRKYMISVVTKDSCMNTQ